MNRLNAKEDVGGGEDKELRIVTALIYASAHAVIVSKVKHKPDLFS